MKKLVDSMLSITVRILHCEGETGMLKGFASGFLYQPDPQKPPFIITAGHNTPPNGCMIEMHAEKGKAPALINAGEFKVFHKEGGIDYAYSLLPYKLILEHIEDEEKFDLVTYQHQFERAIEEEDYAFAVWNNGSFIKNDDKFLVERLLCYELGMRLVKQTESVNYFKTSSPIKDHDHYYGASGSPVASIDGTIIGILIGGTTPVEYLRVFRLDNITLPVDYY